MDEGDHFWLMAASAADTQGASGLSTSALQTEIQKALVLDHVCLALWAAYLT